jgi:hypothetical protein
MTPVVVTNVSRADVAGMDAFGASTVHEVLGRNGERGRGMYKMRKALAKAGLVYLARPEQA